MRLKKRSQVTLFIVIGIVILFSTLIIWYIRSQTTTTEDKVTAEKGPVQTYVEQCLKQVSDQALEYIGMQGGYITMEGADKITAEKDPFNSRLLSVADGRLLLPYWLYQDYLGLDNTEMPALEKSYDGDYSIEWQLEDYVDNHMESCLDDFKVFEPQGIDVAEMGVLKTDVIMTDNNVNFKLHYPINVYKPDGDMESLSDFYAEVPVRLKRIYTLAKEIRDHEMQSVFLERDTRNLITLYSRIDSDYLPPMYGGLHFEQCSDRVFWLYNDVYSNFKDMLIANIPYLRVADTSNGLITVNDPDEKNRKIRQGIYNNMVQDVSDDAYPSISADFSYRKDFPLQLDFGGYGLLEPNSFQVDLLFSQLCMFEYQFAYNVKYPVLVTLTDSKSELDGRDYMFEFPMEVVLKDNFPRVRYTDAFGSAPEPAVASECEPEQRLSGNITINVVDPSGNGIDDANVYFQCGPSMVYDFYDNGTVKDIKQFADKCFMGTTDNGILRERFPQCQKSGMVTISRDGYAKRTELIGDTLQGKDRTMTFTMDKIYSMKLDVKKYFVKPPDGQTDRPGVVVDDNDDVTACNVYDTGSSLQSYENALIRLTKTDLDKGELTGPSVAYYSPGNTSNISISPGTYHIEIILMRNERFNGEMTIKKHSESKKIEGTLVSDSKTIYYPDEDVLLPSVFTGGAMFNWTVTREELESGSTVTFHVFDEGAPKTLEEVSVPLKHREGCSELNPDLVRPVIS